ncbi:MAG TPA: hypothetical protein VEZ90_02050 [Blastocatellia bacterium]|nr:hypothetical protein [Blastocatellia bacterium]
MSYLKVTLLPALLAIGAFSFAATSQSQRHSAIRSTSIRTNSWHGITPLVSSSADVAALLSAPQVAPGVESSGPYRADGGEVTFSYVTPNEAKIYHAPDSLIGKVFTIYFRPDPPLKPASSIATGQFKRCDDKFDVRYYYYVSRDRGLAYQIRKSTNEAEVVIYQPLHSEIMRLKVDTTCVF